MANQPKISGLKIFLLLFTLTSLYLLWPEIAVANDGGVSESGNVDWWTWLTSSGGNILLEYSVPCGISSGIGAPFGAALGNLLGANPAGGMEMGEAGQIGREPGVQPNTHIEQELVSDANAVQQLANAGYPVVRDAAGNVMTDAFGNPLVLVPNNWGGGFHGGAYNTITVWDPVNGRNVQVLDPNSTTVIQDVTRPDVENLATDVLSGQKAMDVLEQAGMVVRIQNADGTYRYQPVAGFENLNGKSTTIRTAESIDPTTGEVVGAQEAKIHRVDGIGYQLRPDGSLDPNVAIIVSKTEPGDSLGRVGRWDTITHPMPGVEVQGDPGFVTQVANDLNTIDSLPSGQNTLDGIFLSGNTATIKQIPPGRGNSSWNQHYNDGYRNGADGPGTNVTVGYDPTRNFYGSGLFPWDQRPSDVGLHHELVHALHATNGQMQHGNVNDPITGTTIPRTEAQATGLPPFAGNDPNNPTDNSYRNERAATSPGLVPRPSYVL